MPLHPGWPVQGTLKRTSAHGTIALHLVADSQGMGPVGVGGNYRYTVSGATGRYSEIQDAGTASLSTMPNNAADTPLGVQHGRFTLVLTSAVS